MEEGTLGTDGCKMATERNTRPFQASFCCIRTLNSGGILAGVGGLIILLLCTEV